MLELTIYYNFDERQAHTFRARTEEALLSVVERTIRKDGKHNCDGWTLGKPDENEPHVTMSFSESSPDEYAWEVIDHRDTRVAWLPHMKLEATEFGTFDETFDRFWAFARSFARNGNSWEGLI